MTERRPEQPEDDWGSPQTPWNPPEQPAHPPPPPASAPQQPTYPPPPPASAPQQPTYPPQPHWQQPTQPWRPAPPGPTPNFVVYLILSIVATLFCCLPTGIVAIVYAVQIQSKLSAGDVPGAERASKRAQIWLIVSVALGLLFLFIYFVAFAASSGSTY